MMAGYGGLGLLGPVLMVLFWGGLLALVVWIAGAAFSRQGTAIRAEPSALEVLKQRYARGEIDKEAFERARRDLV